jgi:hypothetical protein
MSLSLQFQAHKIDTAKESAITAFRNGRLMTPANAQEFSFAPVPQWQ